ncbi:MAG: hypothetical protein ABJB09_07680, partial [Verrucomicrobiota bacterium]
MSNSELIETRINRLHKDGLVDMHFDLPLGLQWRGDQDVIAKEFLPEFVAGDIGVLGVAIYVEDRFLDKALDVALSQVARLHTGVAYAERLVICRTFAEIRDART